MILLFSKNVVAIKVYTQINIFKNYNIYWLWLCSLDSIPSISAVLSMNLEIPQKRHLIITLITWNLLLICFSQVFLWKLYVQLFLTDVSCFLLRAAKIFQKAKKNNDNPHVFLFFQLKPFVCHFGYLLEVAWEGLVRRPEWQTCFDFWHHISAGVSINFKTSHKVIFWSLLYLTRLVELTTL